MVVDAILTFMVIWGSGALIVFIAGWLLSKGGRRGR